MIDEQERRGSGRQDREPEGADRLHGEQAIEPGYVDETDRERELEGEAVRDQAVCRERQAGEQRAIALGEHAADLTGHDAEERQGARLVLDGSVRSERIERAPAGVPV